ncbi:hypothetical protein [Saliniramus fredricksonii]|nr:hypothetical protein [Saliniramus fredricksonii]
MEQRLVVHRLIYSIAAIAVMLAAAIFALDRAHVHHQEQPS